jgi:hypothetical protein
MGQAQQNRGTVLIVEDDAELRGFAARLLEDGQPGTARIRAIVRDNYRRSAPTPPAPKNIVDTLLEKFGPKAD